MILKILKAIRDKWFCTHDWETIKLMKMYENDGDENPYGERLNIGCTKCGQIKQIRL